MFQMLKNQIRGLLKNIRSEFTNFVKIKKITRKSQIDFYKIVRFFSQIYVFPKSQRPTGHLRIERNREPATSSPHFIRPATSRWHVRTHSPASAQGANYELSRRKKRNRSVGQAPKQPF